MALQTAPRPPPVSSAELLLLASKACQLHLRCQPCPQATQRFHSQRTATAAAAILQGSNPSAVVWDVMAVLHEIGHNFNRWVNTRHRHGMCSGRVFWDAWPVVSEARGHCQTANLLPEL